MADGVWHWRVLAPGPQGWGEVYHRLYVTEGGAATLAGAGDATGDGLVDVNDLLAVIGAWGPCAWPASSCPSDIAFDYSFTVDMADLLEVIDQWR
jgi:hypothetical protein